MCQVVDDVASDTTTEGGSAHVPVGIEDGVRKLPEWKSERDEECWRHDETVSIHWQVVVNAVKEEMSSKSKAVVRKVAVELLAFWFQMKYDMGELTRRGGRGNGACHTRSKSTRKGRVQRTTPQLGCPIQSWKGRLRSTPAVSRPEE